MSEKVSSVDGVVTEVALGPEAKSFGPARLVSDGELTLSVVEDNTMLGFVYWTFNPRAFGKKRPAKRPHRRTRSHGPVTSAAALPWLLPEAGSCAPVCEASTPWLGYFATQCDHTRPA